MRRSVGPWPALALLSAAACATAGAPRLAYTPDELRAAVARAAPAVPPADVVVPYELTPQQAAVARGLTWHATSRLQRTELLARALFDPDRFHLRYTWSVTATAGETLARGEGNCFSLASVFIGLARAAGLQAFYVDASSRVHETRLGDDGLVVHAGHVSAIVRQGAENVSLDLDGLGRIVWYRVLSDVEALAHFYNDRGYDRIAQAERDGAAVDWPAVAHDFWIATQIAPDFAQAWSNLGLASARLGRAGEARDAYRTAIRLAPDLPAPRNDLGVLELEAGDAAAAREALEAAARLEPGGAHVQFNLATARLRTGDAAGAVEALRRAIALRGSYPDAQALLERLTRPAS